MRIYMWNYEVGLVVFGGLNLIEECEIVGVESKIQNCSSAFGLLGHVHHGGARVESSVGSGLGCQMKRNVIVPSGDCVYLCIFLK